MLVAFGRGAIDGGDLRSVIARSRETATTYDVELMVFRGACAARDVVGGRVGPSDLEGEAEVVLPPVPASLGRDARCRFGYR